MGEAKRRKAEMMAWRAGLTEAERVVADVSAHVHQRLAKEAGYVRACFFLAFLLRKYLREEKGIEISPVVGWASWSMNFFPHAWAELGGKRIDLSLTQTTDNIVAPPGDLLILDKVVERGQVSYAYHPETTPEIEFAARAGGPDGLRRITDVERKRAIAASDAAIDQYFEEAPEAYRYPVVLRLLA